MSRHVSVSWLSSLWWSMLYHLRCRCHVGRVHNNIDGGKHFAPVAQFLPNETCCEWHDSNEWCWFSFNRWWRRIWHRIMSFLSHCVCHCVVDFCFIFLLTVRYIFEKDLQYPETFFIWAMKFREWYFRVNQVFGLLKNRTTQKSIPVSRVARSSTTTTTSHIAIAC